MILVTQLRINLKQEGDLVEHLRWKVEYRSSRLYLLAMELGHVDLSHQPPPLCLGRFLANFSCNPQ